VARARMARSRERLNTSRPAKLDSLLDGIFAMTIQDDCTHREGDKLGPYRFVTGQSVRFQWVTLYCV